MLKEIIMKEFRIAINDVQLEYIVNAFEKVEGSINDPNRLRTWLMDIIVSKLKLRPTIGFGDNDNSDMRQALKLLKSKTNKKG